MLESGDVLRTWALERLPRDWQAAHTRTTAAHPNCPLLGTENTVAATQLGDHRRDYLELQGTLSGDRGAVIRVATGTYRNEYEAPGKWQMALTGDDIAAVVRLSQSEADEKRWTLSCV